MTDLDYRTAAEIVRSGETLYPAVARTSAVDDIEIKPVPMPLPAEAREAILVDPGFGKYPTDHMVQIQWTADRGWHDAELIGYQDLHLNPSTAMLHYGQSIFEGLKAYRHADGSIYTFRPEANALRFQRSARRLAMAELPTELFIGSIEALVRADRDWVPTDSEKSLYIRPFQLGMEVGLGVRPASSYTYYLMAGPVGAYFPQGVKPVSVWLTTEFVRAAPGGTGEAKCAGNYAASLVAQAEASRHGCDQVVWLDAAEHRWVEEMGGMNLFFVYGSGDDARLMTPALTGTLLPGVTRDSLLQLADRLGIKAEEGRISIEDWQSACASGEISEVFACGTAAVITPVGQVKSASASWTIADGQPGPLTMRLREALLGIQTGTAPDTEGWLHKIC